MDNKKIKIAFLGAGAFAHPVLEAMLKDERLAITRIVTQIDKPAGRKAILTPSPLGKWCEQAGIGFERCRSVNTPDFLDSLRKDAIDLVVVVSFGQLLKEELLNLPRLGCLNVHASLLPKYRGASPIVSSVLNGESETGVSFMRMDKGLDTGPVYQQFKMPISDTITACDLEIALAELAGQHIGDCICALEAGTIQVQEQNHAEATLSRKIKKEYASIDWSLSAQQLSCKIRAFHPWPSAVFVCPGAKRNISVKITQAEISNAQGNAATPGTILNITKAGIEVACGSGNLLLKRLIPEGKKEMGAKDFANGAHLETGSVFQNGPFFEQ